MTLSVAFAVLVAVAAEFVAAASGVAESVVVESVVVLSLALKFVNQRLLNSNYYRCQPQLYFRPLKNIEGHKSRALVSWVDLVDAVRYALNLALIHL